MLKILSLNKLMILKIKDGDDSITNKLANPIHAPREYQARDPGRKSDYGIRLSLICAVLFIYLYRESKKSEFYLIEHLLIGFSPYYGQHVSKNCFWSFLTKTKQDKEFPSLCIGKFGPTESYFGYDFWAENGLQRGTDLGPKIKNGCCGALVRPGLSKKQPKISSCL